MASSGSMQAERTVGSAVVGSVESLIERSTDKKVLRRHETVDRVLKAARELLTTDGEQALSLRKLAARTGLSPNTIYAHFGKQRSEIVDALIADALTDIGDVDDRELDVFKAGSTPWEAAVDQYLSHPDFYRAITLLRTGDRPFKHAQRNLIKVGRKAQELLLAALNDGLLKPDTDLPFLFEHLSLLFTGIADRWARQEIDAAAFRRHVLYAVFSALHVNATEAGQFLCAPYLSNTVLARRKARKA